MSARRRLPRTPLRVRLGDWLSHVGDRYINARFGDIATPSTPAQPVVLDHVHQEFDATGTCLDQRCGFDLTDDPHTQVVREVPLGEPDWMPEAQP